MDSQNGHDFVSVDLTYDDDLISSTGWSAPGNPQYHYPQNTQDQYLSYQGQLNLGQPPFDHLSVSQHPSYSSLLYENSPYGNQLQRPSNLYAPAFTVDSSIQTPQSYNTQDRSYSFTPSTNENATISPQTLQYSVVQHQEVRNPVSNIDFKPNANILSDNFPERSQDCSLYYNNERKIVNHHNKLPQFTELTDTPQVVDSRRFVEKANNISTPTVVTPVQRFQTKSVGDQKTSLRVTRPDLYESKNISSRPRFEYAPFVVWEDVPLKITVGLKNTLPKYHPRRSRSGKELISGFDVSKSLTPVQISTRKRGGGQPLKDPVPSLNRSKASSIKPKSLVSSPKVQVEDSSTKIVKPPPGSSSSETESSSESESEYDEEIPIINISDVRGTTRPLDLPQATRWDTIGLVWRDPNSNPSADSIKDAIEKYANFVSALRSKIKTNSTKIEATVVPGEITKLQTERRELLESLYQTISAANELGYGPIIENLGGHHKLVNGLTTTLIECIKADDFIGKLPKAVLTLLAKFKALTDELLRKLKFDSIQKRWNKKGDDQSKKLIATILTNTTDAKEKLAKVKKCADDKVSLIKEDLVKVKATENSSSLGPNPGKRSYEGDISNGKPSKKAASEITNFAAIAKSLVPKRGMSNLLGISTKNAVKIAAKRREPSPPSESKLGALLASIAKDPEPPKLPEAPARAPETPQEKAKRERKESRRHLRVKFKEGSDLEEVRLFKHEEAEDEGRQDEMLRDAHDDRLEGMMHKKRVSEAIDDDEDYQPSETELPYPKLCSINFNLLIKTSHFGQTFTSRGGDLEINSNETRKQKERESLELMVVYTDSADIPYTPKEPPLDNKENIQPEVQIKESTEPWLIQRLQDIQRYGPEYALQLFILQNNPVVNKQNKTSEITSVLQELGRAGLQSLNRHTEHQMDLTAFSNLVAWVKYLSGKPYPATEPPEWMSLDAKNEWIKGYHRDMLVFKNSGVQNDLTPQQNQIPTASSSIINMPYQQAFPSQNNFSQNVSQPNYSSVPNVTQVLNHRATYQTGENSISGSGTFDYNNWTAQNAKTHKDTEPTTDQDLSQIWDNDGDTDSVRNNQFDNSGMSATQRNFEQQFVDPKTKYSTLFDENGEYKGKKKPCRFWAEGKCAKGAKCTFLHS